MADELDFIIGAEVVCQDGPAGTLKRLVINPVSQSITHIVVEGPAGPSGGVLAPVDGAVMDNGRIKLACTLEHFSTFESAEDARILPSPAEQFGHHANDLSLFPYHGLGYGSLGMMGMGMGGGLGIGGFGMGPLGASSAEVTDRRVEQFDRVPLGEVEIRPGDAVHATDGEIGHVLGLVVDPSNNHVSHILLAEGHLWGKREVAIPISAVTSLANHGVAVSLTKDQIEALPPIDVDHPAQGLTTS